jgi:hypothetical protein
MQLFLKLFGPCLQWVYHCFDRIVITGHLLGLLRENQVVYFFQQVCGHPKLTQDLLRQRTRDYQQWVQHFARNHRLPLEWPAKGTRKEEFAMKKTYRIGVIGFAHMHVNTLLDEFAKLPGVQWTACADTVPAVPPQRATLYPNSKAGKRSRSGGKNSVCSREPSPHAPSSDTSAIATVAPRWSSVQLSRLR